MSWRASGDTYRMPVAVDNTAGGAGAIDVSAALPLAWDHFWTTVQSTGNDVRVTQADGTTLVTFDLDAFNTTTRAGTVEIDNFTAAAAGMILFWLYWGDSSLSSGVTSFAPASPKTGYFDLGQPAEPLVRVTTQQRLGDTSPIAQVSKTSDSTIYVWYDFGPVLQKRWHPHNNSQEFETISYVSGVTVTLSAVDQAAMKDITKTRYEGGPDGQLYVRALVKAGSTGSDYIQTVTVVTTEGRTLTGVAKILVRDMS